MGFSVIEFAENVLEIDLIPWQRWLAVHMLELLEDNSLRFRTVVVLVARQNGKSTLSQVVALWFMYVYGFMLVLGTAQDLDTAEEVWQGAVDLVEENPELVALRERVILVNGKKSLELKTGQRYKVKAATRRAGRGLSGDLILLDELREHQSWDAWGAITKTTMARAMALILVLSNAGDAASIVLRYLRKMAHAALGDPDGINAADDPAALLPDDEDEADEFELDDEDSLGIFEWSAPPECDIRDRDGWAQANPSLGYTITERTIASACKTDPEWVFRTEVLCQWSDGTLEGPFPPGSWEGSTDPESKPAPNSPLALCVDVSWDRSTTHIAIAGTRPDGLPHVGVIASRVGTDWVVPWLLGDKLSPLANEDAAKRVLGVVVQSSSAPASSLIEDLQEADVEVLDWKGPDLGKACGTLYDLVRLILGEQDEDALEPSLDGEVRGLRHRGQPLLNVAAATAVTKPAGDAWLWDRKKSPTDIAPLVAVTGALWGLMTADEPTESAYENAGLRIV